MLTFEFALLGRQFLMVSTAVTLLVLIAHAYRLERLLPVDVTIPEAQEGRAGAPDGDPA